MNQKPFIHLFKTTNGFYFYDVNTDAILKIDKDVYDYLEKEQLGELPNFNLEYVDFLKNQGYLKSNKVKLTEHPETEFIKYHCKNKVESLILQVTQNCNLHCEYCAYSGGYINRVHNNKRMSKDTAKKAIDFLIKHSKDSNELHIGFYGGEPLLEFDLIKWAILYSKSNVENKEIYFNFTTNATLLQEELIEFFEEHNVNIMISLDGPREIHDKNRVFSHNKKGSFDVIMRNLKIIADRHPKYFKDRVSFNTVLATDNFSCVDKFIGKDELLRNALFLSSLVSEFNAKEKQVKNDTFYEESQYALFIGYLNLLGRVTSNNSSKLLKNQVSNLGDSRKGKKGRQRLELPEKWHHGGPCIPGVMRLFVNADGDFYPCEKVCETSDEVIIGNLDKGFDLNKIENILNIERENSEECHNCWAYQDCKICIASRGVENIQENLQIECERVRHSVESDLKDYCVLSDLGYDFETRDFIEKHNC